jgi:dTDP-4-dehydrorhamnose reductase
MRALIFGGTGMLGRAVVREARLRGHAALALSRAQADVTDRERVRYWADAFRPTVVFNCAAFTRVDDCEHERERAFAVNGEAVSHLAEAAREVAARLVQVSTDYVFDGRADRPYHEDDATAPLSVYGASKLDGERRALAHDDALAVRASWLFGPGGANFVATMLDLMDAGRTPLRVVDDQLGCPTYTPYLARALWDLAAAGSRGVVHYRNRDPVTWYGFTREIAHLWDRRVEVVPVTSDEFPRPAPRPAYSVLDVERFESITGRRVEPWGLGLVEYLATRQRRQTTT